MPDYFTEVLLDDLVKSGAWLDLELKIPFLALWVMKLIQAFLNRALTTR